MVPDAGGDNAARRIYPLHCYRDAIDARLDSRRDAGDACHLAQTCHRIGHEVDDELRQRGVEAVVREGQRVGGGALHVDGGQALTCCCDEGLGRIHGRD